MKIQAEISWRKEAFQGFSNHSGDIDDCLLYSPIPQGQALHPQSSLPFSVKAIAPCKVSYHWHSYPELSTSTCDNMSTSFSLWLWRQKKKQRDTWLFCHWNWKAVLEKRCQGPAGHIFSPKHCKMSRGFTWRSCLGMCLLFLEQQTTYLKQYIHVWCRHYHDKCNACFGWLESKYRCKYCIFRYYGDAKIWAVVILGNFFFMIIWAH